MTVEFGGVRLNIRFSFAATVTLMLLFCDEKIVLMSLFSSVFHELGHLFFIVAAKDRIQSIELGFFGMIIERSCVMLSYKNEALIAMGGIIFNCAVIIGGLVVYFITDNNNFLLLAVVNAFVAAINMLPVRVLDCGRCIYCLLCDRNDEAESEKKLDTMSKVVALISLVLCIAVFLISGFNFSLAAVTIYLNIITFFKKWS